MNKSRDKIIRLLEKEFAIEDKREPFSSRDYASEAKRILKLLKGDIGDHHSATDRATYDIISGIFEHLEKTRYHLPQNNVT